MIVITGGAGFIGSALLWKLNSLGEKDIIIVDQKAKNSPKWKNLSKSKFNDYVEYDEFLESLDTGRFKGKVKVKSIFHLGACADTTENDLSYLRRHNSGYSEKLCQWALQEKAYFQYASSAATYGNGEEGYSDADELNGQLKPLNPYGQSKLDFDLWVLKNNLQNKITGFRFFNVYGPNEYHKGEMRSMVHKGFGQIQTKGSLRLFKSHKSEYKDGEQKREFVYIKDVLDVMIWFYRHPETAGIYNLGTGKAQTWNELASSLFSACKKKSLIEYIDMPSSIRNQYQYFTEADLSKLKSVGAPCNFRPLKDGVTDYVQNYLLTPDPYL
jgi:ADP-L-glycero-D-manno-heptose 6-epimerase